MSYSVVVRFDEFQGRNPGSLGPAQNRSELIQLADQTSGPSHIHLLVTDDFEQFDYKNSAGTTTGTGTGPHIDQPSAGGVNMDSKGFRTPLKFRTNF
jgi:hypothetical protein